MKNGEPKATETPFIIEQQTATKSYKLSGHRARVGYANEWKCRLFRRSSLVCFAHRYTEHKAGAMTSVEANVKREIIKLWLEDYATESSEWKKDR